MLLLPFHSQSHYCWYSYEPPVWTHAKKQWLLFVLNITVHRQMFVVVVVRISVCCTRNWIIYTRNWRRKPPRVTPKKNRYALVSPWVLSCGRVVSNELRSLWNMHDIFEISPIYHRGVISAGGAIDRTVVRWVVSSKLGTPTQAAKRGHNKGSDTASRGNWHLLTPPRGDSIA